MIVQTCACQCEAFKRRCQVNASDELTLRCSLVQHEDRILPTPIGLVWGGSRNRGRIKATAGAGSEAWTYVTGISRLLDLLEVNLVTSMSCPPGEVTWTQGYIVAIFPSAVCAHATISDHKCCLAHRATNLRGRCPTSRMCVAQDQATWRLDLIFEYLQAQKHRRFFSPLKAE